VDNLFLQLQSALDRAIRRLRRGRRPARMRRRLLVVQIDGLSRSVFELALAAGHMPHVRRLLASGKYRPYPMSVGMPSSTPAFQMAAMYGVQPDIPGFHYHDKRRRVDVHFPRAGHAAEVEAAHVAGRRGILEGGSVYGCVFTGGAENDFWSFSALTRPSGHGLVRVVSGLMVVLWVLLKGVTQTVVELAKLAARCLADPRRARRRFRWTVIKVGVSIWVRQFFTAEVARDLYDGIPAIYVNYLDYDVAAHAFGPRDRAAFRALQFVDRSIRQLSRVIRRVPEHQYDLFILSDHGQAASVPFVKLAGGRPFERVVFDDVLDAKAPPGALMPRSRNGGYPHGFAAYRIGRHAGAEARRPERDLGPGREDREAYERGGVRVISAGPNAFLYVVDTPDPLAIEEIEQRFPGLAEHISAARGVGFVLARSADGAACFHRGARQPLDAAVRKWFPDRDDREIVVRDLETLVAMPSAGDLIIYGTGAPEGNVSYVPEVGAHAGPSPDELHTFIVAPTRVAVPPVTHPLALYDLFIAYQEAPDSAHRREL
jgi:hypothetical protein